MEHPDTGFSKTKIGLPFLAKHLRMDTNIFNCNTIYEIQALKL